MPVTRTLPPLPPANIAMTDPKTGMLTRAWYEFFVSLLSVLNEMKGAIP